MVTRMDVDGYVHVVEGGEYMYFEDHQAEVAQLQARVAELEAALADESEKAAFWASKAHEMRGQALRGEPVDGIIQP